MQDSRGKPWVLTSRRYSVGIVTGHWLLFFSLQAPLLFLEDVVKEWGAHRGIKLPKIVSIPITLFLILIMTDVRLLSPILDVTDIGKVVAIRVWENVISPLKLLSLFFSGKA